MTKASVKVLVVAFEVKELFLVSLGRKKCEKATKSCGRLEEELNF